MKQNLEEILDARINQSSSLNVKLLKILPQLEDKINLQHHQTLQNTTNQPQKSSLSDQTVQKNLKSIQNRIQLYQKELSNFDNLKLQNLITQIKQLEQQIMSIRKKQRQYSKLIKQLQAQLNSSYKKKQTFNLNNYQSSIQTLQQRLQRLDSYKASQHQFPVPNQKRRKIKSYSQIQNNEEKLSPKKKDKSAFFRNLIRYYLNEEKKLKEDIRKLQKIRKCQKEEQEKIDAQIQEFKLKIQEKKKKIGKY